jgi:poly-D-alanine transfer protein DltD
VYKRQAIYVPLIFCDYALLNLKEKLIPGLKSNDTFIKRHPIVPVPLTVNWDSLYAVSKEEVIRKSTNNAMGIADEYYDQYIHGKKGNIEPVTGTFNQELEDFKMLLKLLKEKQVNASFIISPLNALYYKNLKSILPTIKSIENEIRNERFNYLNLLETDSAKYEKPILHDVMHMSDYGWYKVDHFIIGNYHLSQ